MSDDSFINQRQIHSYISEYTQICACFYTTLINKGLYIWRILDRFWSSKWLLYKKYTRINKSGKATIRIMQEQLLNNNYGFKYSFYVVCLCSTEQTIFAANVPAVTFSTILCDSFPFSIFKHKQEHNKLVKQRHFKKRVTRWACFYEITKFPEHALL